MPDQAPRIRVLVGDDQERGAIVALYGSPIGLINKHNTVLNQTTIGSIEKPEPGDRFGETLAAGDFNHDGIEDLAVGVPGEDILIPGPTPSGLEIQPYSGTVHIVFGSSGQGLGPLPPAQTFSPFTPGLCCFTDEAEFGAALAVGDFNFDTIDDLAIGAPFNTVDFNNHKVASGAVLIMKGAVGVGLVQNASLYLHEGLLTQFTEPQWPEKFGWSLAAGHFSAEFGDSLAIGAPGEMGKGDKQIGAVWIVYFPWNPGSGAQLLVDTPPVGDGPGEGEEYFGWSLAAGNFDGILHDDLAIGIPWNISHMNQNGGISGAVSVVYSDAFELNPQTAQFFFPGDFADGVVTPAPPEDESYEFGASLAAGDYQGDGVADLFIGVPALDLSKSLENVGGVEIRPGVGLLGLPGPSFELLTQNTPQPNQTWEAEKTHVGFQTNIINFFFIGERMGYSLGK